MNHDGDLDGWRDELQGATEVTANFYRIDVPEEGEVTVTTVIEALEPAGGTGWWAALIRLIREILRRCDRFMRRLTARLRSLVPGA